MYKEEGIRRHKKQEHGIDVSHQDAENLGDTVIDIVVLVFVLILQHGIDVLHRDAENLGDTFIDICICIVFVLLLHCSV